MKIKCKWMIWWSNHKLYLLLHKLAGLHSAKMAISNWANPSPPPTPSSLSLSCQVMWQKKQNQHHRARVVLFVGARCESLQQTAQLSADMHYTKISMNIMTQWWISWHLYKDIHENHDKMMLTTIIDWLTKVWRWKVQLSPEFGMWQKFKDKVQLYLRNYRGGVLLNYIFLGVFVEKVVICQLHPINQIPAAPRYRLCILRFLPTIHNFSFLKV